MIGTQKTPEKKDAWEEKFEKIKLLSSYDKAIQAKFITEQEVKLICGEEPKIEKGSKNSFLLTAINSEHRRPHTKKPTSDACTHQYPSWTAAFSKNNPDYDRLFSFLQHVHCLLVFDDNPTILQWQHVKSISIRHMEAILLHWKDHGRSLFEEMKKETKATPDNKPQKETRFTWREFCLINESNLKELNADTLVRIKSSYEGQPNIYLVLEKEFPPSLLTRLLF